PLSTNYRSKKAIVDFNNAIFKRVCDVIATIEGLNDLSTLRLAYGKDVEQLVAEKNGKGGYVEVRFIEQEKKVSPSEKAELQLTLETIQDLLSRGYRYRDITILVRKKKEGNQVAKFLFDNGINKVISPDSLLIEGSSKVRFIINLFRLLADPGNAVARSQALHYYMIAQGGEHIDLNTLFEQSLKWRKGGKKNDRSGPGSKSETVFQSKMPAEFVSSMAGLAKMPVYEISEQLVRIFRLGDPPDAFVQRFQDLVLEFNSRQHASLQSFLQWWDSNEKVREKSVVIPENEDAIRIMTIHRSKGLQFPAVIMPFVGWDILPKSNEIVWLSSAEPPYSALGKVGIRANKELSESYFHADWNTEQTNSIIDNLNLLYVAFTRPEQELYLFAPATSAAAKKNEQVSRTNHLLERTLAAAGIVAQPDGVIRCGEKTADHMPATHTTGSDMLTEYPVHRWQDKIRVSSRTRKLADLLAEKSTDKARYGVLVHDLLATIKTLDDVDGALERIAFDGLLPDSEKEQLKKIVLEISEHPSIRPFFETDWEIRREVEILTPAAQTLRPDRTLTKGDQAVIVDFKTGAPDEKHKNQLNEYGSLLSEMGYASVRKYLVYFQDGATVLEVEDDIDNVSATS
ncbi:MAG: UvrD-helicase domain-containing protein, partial [Bacteroidota bacterium]